MLFQNSEPWVKKLENEHFDVTMGCYYSAELCELVGSFILNKLTSIVKKSDISVYREDRLGIFYNVSKPEIEREQKVLFKVFKECGLTITIQCSLKTVDFLNVTFDLNNNAYKSFRKDSNKPIYINKHSNHPPSILKHLPNQLKNEYPKRHPIRIFLMNQ